MPKTELARAFPWIIRSIHVKCKQYAFKIGFYSYFDWFRWTIQLPSLWDSGTAFAMRDPGLAHFQTSSWSFWGCKKTISQPAACSSRSDCRIFCLSLKCFISSVFANIWINGGDLFFNRWFFEGVHLCCIGLTKRSNQPLHMLGIRPCVSRTIDLEKYMVPI